MSLLISKLQRRKMTMAYLNLQMRLLFQNFKTGNMMLSLLFKKYKRSTESTYLNLLMKTLCFRKIHLLLRRPLLQRDQNCRKISLTLNTPSRLYDPNDELKTDTFQSPEGNMISLDAFTPKHLIRILEPDLQDLQDVEQEIQNCGLLIKEYEEDLKDLEIIRDGAVLNLQASMDVLPLDQSDMSQKEEVSRKIQNKVGSAAAVYSACLRNIPLKELDPTIMANVFGIVALLGTAPTHTLSRQVDVHFPVVALEHLMVVFPDKPDIKALIAKKEAAEEAIAFTNKERNICLKQFQERYAVCYKLIEYKEASQKLQLSQSQESLKFLPRPSQTSV